MANSEKATFRFTKKTIDGLAAPDPSGKQRLFWAMNLPASASWSQAPPATRLTSSRGS